MECSRWVVWSFWEKKLALGLLLKTLQRLANLPHHKTHLSMLSQLGCMPEDIWEPHLEMFFCTKIVQCLRKKKKSYLVGVCLCERGVMLKTLFSPGTATLSQTLQGSHIRGNVIHSLALHSSFLHLSPNELPLNYHFTSALPFYDSICLSISDFLDRLPPCPGTHRLFNFIGHRLQAVSRGIWLVI